MKPDNTLLMTAQCYAEAYAVRGVQRPLRGALQSRVGMIAPNPGAPEAGCFCTFSLGIVNQVVAAGELLSIQTALALHHRQPKGGGTATASRS